MCIRDRWREETSPGAAARGSVQTWAPSRWQRSQATRWSGSRSAASQIPSAAGESRHHTTATCPSACSSSGPARASSATPSGVIGRTSAPSPRTQRARGSVSTGSPRTCTTRPLSGGRGEEATAYPPASNASISRWRRSSCGSPEAASACPVSRRARTSPSTPPVSMRRNSPSGERSTGPAPGTVTIPAPGASRLRVTNPPNGRRGGERMER